MKNKLTLLSALLLVSLSLTSCVAKETRIETNTGNILVSSSLENTKKHIKDMSNEDFMSILLNSSNTSSYDIKFTAYDPEASTFTQEYSSSSESSLSLQANLNTKGLNNKPNASLEESELYFETLSNSTTSFKSTPSFGFDFDNSSSLLTKNNLIANELVSYTLENGKSTTKSDKLDTNETNEIAEDLLGFLRFEENVLETLPNDNIIEEIIPSFDIDELFPQADENEFKNKFDSFMNGSISAEEYIEYLNSVSEEPIYTEETKKEIIDALKFLKQGNITKYLQYTKIKKNKQTTISSTLNFASYKEDINKLHDELHIDGETSPISLSHLLYGLTPDNMDLSFSFTINNNNVIESLSYNTTIKGTIPSTVLTEIIGTSMLGALDVHYNVSLSGNISLKLDTKKVEVSTISEPTNKQIEEQ